MEDSTDIRCDICGEAGSRFVMLGQKGADNADFYWVCAHCEKAIRWVFARMDESESEKCHVRRHRGCDKIS